MLQDTTLNEDSVLKDTGLRITDVRPTLNIFMLKGLSHEIFRPVFWPVWTHLGLNVNRLRFFNEGSSILYSYFRY